MHKLTNHSSERGRDASELKRQFSVKLVYWLPGDQINQLLNNSTSVFFNTYTCNSTVKLRVCFQQTIYSFIHSYSFPYDKSGKTRFSHVSREI